MPVALRSPRPGKSHWGIEPQLLPLFTVMDQESSKNVRAATWNSQKDKASVGRMAGNAGLFSRIGASLGRCRAPETGAIGRLRKRHPSPPDFPMVFTHRVSDCVDFSELAIRNLSLPNRLRFKQLTREGSMASQGCSAIGQPLTIGPNCQ